MDEQIDRRPTDPQPSIGRDVSLPDHEKTGNQEPRGFDRLCDPQRLCKTRTPDCPSPHGRAATKVGPRVPRSEEHTSELQSRSDLVCRLLLEKKKKKKSKTQIHQKQT